MSQFRTREEVCAENPHAFCDKCQQSPGGVWWDLGYFDGRNSLDGRDIKRYLCSTCTQDVLRGIDLAPAAEVRELIASRTKAHEANDDLTNQIQKAVRENARLELTVANLEQRVSVAEGEASIALARLRENRATERDVVAEALESVQELATPQTVAPVVPKPKRK